MKFIVIVGPTAVGKTRFAIEIAEKYQGEIVSADSMQIYRGLDIGSARPTAEERARAVHHLIDFVDPAADFSVAAYQKLARKALADIHSRGRLPVVAGGTGLYVNAILYDMDFSGQPGQEEIRRRLEQEVAEKGNDWLHARLMAQDPDAAQRIHPNNRKKLIRALEVLETSAGARRIPSFEASFRPYPGYRPVLIGLTRDRPQLYARIEQRTDRMLKAGLTAEVRTLLDSGLSLSHLSMMGIGYKELIAHFQGAYDLEEAVRLIKQNSRRYAKRQLTWFRRYPDIRWLNLSRFAGDEAALPALFSLVEQGPA